MLDDASFENAVFHRALLSDSLKLLLDGQLRVEENLSELSDVRQRFWIMVSKLRSYMYDVAVWASLTTGSDPEDVVSLAIIRMAAHKNFEQVLSLTEEGQRQFVRGVIDRSSRLPSYLSRSFDYDDSSDGAIEDEARGAILMSLMTQPKGWE